jgi:hypothetical protein
MVQERGEGRWVLTGVRACVGRQLVLCLAIAELGSTLMRQGLNPRSGTPLCYGQALLDSYFRLASVLFIGVSLFALVLELVGAGGGEGLLRGLCDVRQVISRNLRQLIVTQEGVDNTK